MMNKRKIRDCLRLFGAICFSWLYIPHFLVFLVIGGGKKCLIMSDIKVLECQINIKMPTTSPSVKQ